MVSKAMRASGNDVHCIFKTPSGSIAVQIAWTVSMVKSAVGSALGNHDSKSAGVQPMTRSNFSGTKLGVMGECGQFTL